MQPLPQSSVKYFAGTGTRAGGASASTLGLTNRRSADWTSRRSSRIHSPGQWPGAPGARRGEWLALPLSGVALLIKCLSSTASYKRLSLLLILSVHMQASPSKEEVPSVANEPIGIITIEDVFEE